MTCTDQSVIHLVTGEFLDTERQRNPHEYLICKKYIYSMTTHSGQEHSVYEQTATESDPVGNSSGEPSCYRL